MAKKKAVKKTEPVKTEQDIKIEQLFNVVSNLAKVIDKIQRTPQQNAEADTEEVVKESPKPTKKAKIQTAKVIKGSKGGKKVNKFDSMPERNMQREKKESYNWEPTERRPPKKIIELKCQKCGKEYQDIFKPEKGQPTLCNSCIGTSVSKNYEN